MIHRRKRSRLLPVLLLVLLSHRALGSVDFQPTSDATRSLHHLLDKQSQLILGVSVAAVITARQFDFQMKESWAHQQRLGSSTVIANEYLGSGVPGAILGASLWIAGHNFQDDHAVRAGQAELETLLVTSLSTTALKHAIGRERPDQSDHFAMPSGHTSTVFAVAQVLQEFYGWPIGSVGYALGTFTALSRLSDNRHWLSDTVAGASLGIVVGHAISRTHLERETEISSAEIRFTPYLLAGGGGLLFSKEW